MDGSRKKLGRVMREGCVEFKGGKREGKTIMVEDIE